MTTMNDLGIAIGALPKTAKERRVVRVDLENFKVIPSTSRGTHRIGTVVRYVVNEANRTPTGGRYTSRRITVKFLDDNREWVGQFKKDEDKTVILRPLNR